LQAVNNDRDMRILLIEDTRAGTTETVSRLSPFGEVRAARSLQEARQVVASGFKYDAIVTDMNLGDGRDWRETIRDAIDISAGRPIAAHTADLYPELREEFAKLFSGRVEIFSKREPSHLMEWVRQFVNDQSGAIVETMHRHTAQSHGDIRREVIEFLHDLGVPPPADHHLRNRIAWEKTCLQRWRGFIDTAAKTIIGLAAAGAMTWLATVVWGSQ
jgi:CheY-like chemotaxis protein